MQNVDPQAYNISIALLSTMNGIEYDNMHNTDNKAM